VITDYVSAYDSLGYDSAWSSLLWLEDDYGVQPTPMWITQLSHWQEAVDAQDNIDQGGPISTFSSFQTRITCCEWR
jgi:FKBP12-rapamycin complex-associated protein